MDNALQKLVRLLWRITTWMRERLDDDDMRRAILEELGLDGSAPAPTTVDASDIAAVEAYLASDDPDVLEFIAVADSVTAVLDALETFFTPLVGGLVETLTARQALYVVLQIGSVDLMRRDAPRFHAWSRALGFLDDQIATHELPVYDYLALLRSPVQLFRSARDLLASAWGPMATEEDAARTGDLMFLTALATWAGLRFLEKRGYFPEFEYEVLAGWDPPEGSTDLADSISARAVTWSARQRLPAGTGVALRSTWIAIPEDHGGPGLFLSLGGQLELEAERRGESLKFAVDFPEAVSFFLVGGGGTEVEGSADARLEIEYVRGSAVGGPAIAFPRATGTRLEIGNLGVGLTASTDEVIAKLIFDRSALVLAADDADDFLASLFPSGGIRADFDLAAGWDFLEQEPFLGGSAKLEVVIPVGKPLGPLTIFHVTIGLGLRDGDRLELALRLSLSLRLFAVTGVVDQLGFRLAFRTSETGGRLGPIDRPEFGFVPPKGIGLRVKSAPVKGGGFVFFDPDSGDYGGVLELEIFGRYTLKVVGLINTDLDEAPGFSLLLIGSLEGLEWHLFAGGFLTGIGVVFGMHRTLSVEAFQAGIKNRTLDAILFPEDPAANAPRLLQALKTLFPPAPDQWIAGVSLQASWIDRNIVRIELGFLVEFPSPVRIALLGQAKLTLPREKLELVEVNFDVIGILDVDARRLSIDSVLYDSRIGNYPLTGGLAVRADWGDDPDGAGALGGLHPRFPLPEGFPRLDRLALTIGKGKNPRIRGLAYIGVTSNTFQFGIRAELFAGAGGFSVEGDIGLDLLFEFDPFRFLAELSFRAAVKFKGRTLAGLKVTGALAGPAPWQARGKVRIKFLFVKVSKSFKRTWGDESGERAEPVEIWEVLRAALASSDSWRGQVPVGRPPVSLRPPPPGEFVDLHPLGELEVVQRVVPLGVEMDKFKNAPIAGERRFDLSAAKVNGAEVDARPVEEHFAPGQHFDVDGDAALSRPSFERFEAGVRLGSDEITRGAGVSTNFEYEEVVINERMTRRSVFGSYQIPAPALQAAAEHGAVGLGLRAAAGRYAGPLRPVRRRDPGFAAATVAGIAAQPGVTVRPGASYTEVRQAITRHEAGQAAKRGRLQVVRAHERRAP